MRDANRIKGFLDEIGALWESADPDMRFGQMMWNFNAWHIQTFGQDIFYLEEGELLERLEESLKHPYNPRS